MIGKSPHDFAKYFNAEILSRQNDQHHLCQPGANNSGATQAESDDLQQTKTDPLKRT